MATTTNVETRPGIGYVAATNSLWVTWHRYSDDSDASARLYYTRSTTATLPSPTFLTVQQYPVDLRTAEEQPAIVVGDVTYAYISYEAYSDGFRGSNVYALEVPAAGGAPGAIYQLSATVDDPPLYARGNAGSPKLQWATTTVKGQTIDGPVLLYSKNPPSNGNPDYSTNLGVAQTLYNLEENMDLWLAQVGNSGPTSVAVKRLEASAHDGYVLIEWETSSELNNLGFNLYRAEKAGGEKMQINDVLIDSAVVPGSSGSAGYQYADTTPRAGAGNVYFYWLEIVDISGEASLQGPLEVKLTVGKEGPAK